MRHKIAITDFFPREEKEWWGQEAPIDLEIYFANTDELKKSEFSKDIEVLVVKKKEISKDLISIMKSLRLILKFGHWPIGIDLEACQNAGIMVATKPLLGEISVAEHTIMLILACSRNLVNGHQTVINGDYRNFALKPKKTSEKDISPNWTKLDIEEVYGKTLGIVGFGEIGAEVALRARSFSMKVIYCKRDPLPNYWEEKLGVKYCELSELLKMSDFVSLHLPHTQQTERMIGKREFRLMKNSAYLINVSRGGVVDEGALIWAIRNREIKGAGLDVFTEEPIPYNHPLLKLKNIIFTPHLGGGTGQGLKVQAKEALCDIRNFLKGENLLYNLTFYKND